MTRFRTMTLGVLTAAGLLVAGTGIAAADETTPPPPTQEPITLSAEQSVWLCTERIPRLLDRIDRLQERIDAGADTPGSTARLIERAELARSTGRTEVAERLERRIADRPEKAQRLADAELRITSFRDENCA